MTSRAEIQQQVDDVFTNNVFVERSLLPAQDELRHLQLLEGLNDDDATVELLAMYHATALTELHEEDNVCLIGDGQYYLEAQDGEDLNGNCDKFFNFKNARIMGRYAGFMATTWPRYDNFYRSFSEAKPEAALCIELSETTVYDQRGATNAYLPEYRLFTPLNNTRLSVYRLMEDWIDNATP